ncbi:Molybdenum transport ATP-binding protein ModC (TC 3.A.1.8.1) [Crocosphaera watsonii WH 8502]|uniref:Molybdenum transport ATP-binding protein ModC (TC 3.A.1.8.1) n=5 Tax=Crocosphaera watsonii TaxID=263511 RepID=T2K0B4_CROWT|nr:Molybdenum transport ATP-binding protein modC (TC 3.A.1.8.1) [Crocosphaera watsonii WH 0003]CCQ51759.1 Molybdenum transport ATP-binding protein ModC (TC 3.A.1.8.1) [Crocosphaera watsonii WH 8502]CCQ54293.1 Molybdenum transport ATP-binding protein ModC (TC 3.A.1.8.1) [Crocosphaera watsonii WH 0005]CCQ62828.1 Molybdenum transport ATP-binding protein ModC (TC 3.A.1.8.1) [Crocosphaera watsonii WH 0401]CCQ70854.1 Molybdenum transport ATP-binding protein ModC (TC 3.A.1.8.1) [Crocosphaera watsonii 
MGPTLPWLGELADFGINYLAGVTVSDPTALRQTFAEGGWVRIFETAVQYHLLSLG